MKALARGKFVARFAETDAQKRLVFALRKRVFRAGQTEDEDAFDAHSSHAMISDAITGELVCSFRLLPLRSGAEISRSYSAQFYDLSGLSRFDAPMIEVGRFCTSPDVSDANLLRVAWGFLASHVDAHGCGMLFGCSSFQGADPAAHLEPLALLKERYMGPQRWRPAVKAPEVFRFAQDIETEFDRCRATEAMPALLKTYLRMGGWVSDHAVIDRDLGTIHVFTGLEIAAIPAARKRVLRAIAG
ncbi:MAG: GNAT family N-acyltransferase [Pseudomonadota bacterium]